MAKNLKCNGCGPAWFPNWARIGVFRQECNRHDVDYYYAIDRTTADINFLIKMLQKSHETTWRRYHVVLAIVMYTFVTLFGWAYFNYSKQAEYRKLAEEHVAKMAEKTEGQE